jgi:tetratricopeptide (TPR) repeat protein
MADLEKPFLSFDALSAEVAARLELADAIWRAGTGERFGEALHACDEALALLAEAEAGTGAAAVATGVADAYATGRARLAAALWLKRGHLLEAWSGVGGGAQAVMEALRGYDRAVALLQKTGAADADVSLLAGAWMNRGNALQRLGSEAARLDAIRSYDRTIMLLGAGEVAGAAEEAMARAVTLGAAWLNRGAACRRGEGEASRAEATRSFERAIAELAPLADARPMARRHLASAWTNLGLLRQENKDARGAVEAHEAALRIAAGGADATSEASANDLAALRLNLGMARRGVGEHAAALEHFRKAVAALASREETDAAAADLALRARHAACVVLGEQLAAEGDEVTETTRARLGEAATLVEEGLALARFWAPRGGVGREPGARVFEFGAWLYRSFGRGQLAPYLQAHLEPADAMRIEIARVAVDLARQEIMQKGFEHLMGDAAGDVAAELAGLREVEERLRDTAARLAAAPAKTA